MAQLQFLTLPEINMLVQMLNARVTFLESQWSQPRIDSNVMNFPSRPPTTSLPSGAVPIVDPSVDKKCIVCTRRFLHLKHRMCNRCARRIRREREKQKSQLTSEGDASSEDDESTVRPKFDTSKGPSSKELSSDAPPFVPLKQVMPSSKGVKTPPAVKKRVVLVTSRKQQVVKPLEKSALSIKLKPRSKPVGGVGSAKVSVRKRKAVPSASGEDFPDPPSDMVAQPKYQRGWGPCPERFNVVPETEEEPALWALRKEWQGYADQEAAWEKAHSAFLRIARDQTGVLHTESGKHVKAYSFPPEMSMRQDTLRYLEIHPEVQPWIMRVGPERARFSLDPLKWSRPSWIGKRKSPARRKVERQRMENRKTGPQGTSSSDILDPRQFARDSRPGSPVVEAAISEALPLPVTLGASVFSSSELGGSLGAVGGDVEEASKPQKTPAPVKGKGKAKFHTGGILPPVMIFDSDKPDVRGQAFQAFLGQLVDAWCSDDKQLQSDAKTAANTFWQVLCQQGIVNKEGAVVKRPKWMSKASLEKVFAVLKG